MKKIGYIIFILLGCLKPVAKAQFTLLAKSISMDYPTDGSIKIAVLKNNNTVLAHNNAADGLAVRVFDSAFKQKFKRTIESKLFTTKQQTIEKIYDVASKIVVILSEMDGKNKWIYSILLDKETGKKAGEYLLEKIKLAEPQSAQIFKLHQSNDVLIRTNTDSILGIFYLQPSENKLVKLCATFFGTKTRINHVENLIPNSEFGVKLIDICTNGSNFIPFFYIQNPIDTTNDSIPKGTLFVQNLDPYSNVINSTKVLLTNRDEVEYGIAYYDSILKRVFLFSAITKSIQTDKNHLTFLPYLTALQSDSLRLQSHQCVIPNSYIEETQELKKDNLKYSGLPQQVLSDANGNIHLIYEEMVSDYEVNDTYLGNVAILHLTPSLEPKQGYLISKNQRYYQSILKPSSYVNEMQSSTPTKNVNAFSSFNYFLNDTMQYLVFNSGMGVQKTRSKLVSVFKKYTENAEAIYYKFNALNLLKPQRKKVFQSKRRIVTNSLKYAYVSASYYHAPLNRFIILKPEMVENKKVVRLYWLQP